MFIFHSKPTPRVGGRKARFESQGVERFALVLAVAF